MYRCNGHPTCTGVMGYGLLVSSLPELDQGRVNRLCCFHTFVHLAVFLINWLLNWLKSGIGCAHQLKWLSRYVKHYCYKTRFQCMKWLTAHRRFISAEHACLPCFGLNPSATLSRMQTIFLWYLEIKDDMFYCCEEKLINIWGFLVKWAALG